MDWPREAACKKIELKPRRESAAGSFSPRKINAIRQDAFTCSLIGLLLSLSASAQNISIATGGTGGVYYPIGGGMAAVLSKYVPGMQATAEVTGGSVDNLKLIGSGKP